MNGIDIKTIPGITIINHTPEHTCTTPEEELPMFWRGRRWVVVKDAVLIVTYIILMLIPVLFAQKTFSDVRFLELAPQNVFWLVLLLCAICIFAFVCPTVSLILVLATNLWVINNPNPSVTVWILLVIPMVGAMVGAAEFFLHRLNCKRPKTEHHPEVYHDTP